MEQEEQPDLFHIDKNNLDEELVKQPELMHKAAMKLARAEERWERAKRARDVIEAEISLEVRRDPQKFNIDKLSEDAVKKITLLDKRFGDAFEKVITMRHGLDVCKAMVAAVNDRKYSIQKLVDLRLAWYYAEPKIKGDNKRRLKEEAMDEAFGPRRQ